jgi:translocation and assembly module TamA
VHDRVSVRFVVALVAAMVACSHRDSAQAFDFFGFWGSDESPPPVSRTAISYSVTVEVTGGDKGLKDAAQDVSSLYKLRNDSPPDGEALARRAQGDFGPIVDAMWGAGYYNATVTISIGGASLSILSSDIASFAPAAESYRNRVAAPVNRRRSRPALQPPRDPRAWPGGAELSETELPGRIVRLKPGDSSAGAELRAAQTRIVDYFRKQGHPLARIASVAPVVDHAAHVMDLTFTVDPGPIAPFGDATMNGPHGFDPAIARSFLYIYPGELYSPRAIEDARNSSAKFPRSVECGSPKGPLSTRMAASPTRSTSRTACLTRSAGRRDIRPPTGPPAKSIGRTATFSEARSGCAFRQTSSTRRRCT